MATNTQTTGPDADRARLRAVNQAFYDRLWTGARLVSPARFNTWRLVCEHSAAASERLELGPGMRPRLPLASTHFVDISAPALAALAAAGGQPTHAEIERLPWPDARFDLVCALDVIEHVADDRAALAELARLARPGAVLLVSMPLHPACWTRFDDIVGHRRRYRPDTLAARLAAAGFTVERSAAYGMKPRSSRLVDWGMRQLEHHPQRALWFYNRWLMPLALALQKPLALRDGWIDTERVGEILLVCRRRAD